MALRNTTTMDVFAETGQEKKVKKQTNKQILRFKKKKSYLRFLQSIHLPDIMSCSPRQTV